MSAGMDKAGMRDPQADPRVGDVVQVYPRATDADLPAPLTIVAVDEASVSWERGGEQFKTPKTVWCAPHSRFEAGERRMELIGSTS